MTRIEAIYQGGVFKPVTGIALAENQHVRLTIQPIQANDVKNWLERVQQRQKDIVAKRGFFPDSTADIAEDRLR